MTNSPARAPGGYGAGIRGLHWLLFGMLAVQYILVWLLGVVGQHGSGHRIVIVAHMSFGTLILLTAIALIVTRLTGSRPSNAFLPNWQQRLSQITHALLYVLMLVQPLIGLTLVMNQGHGVPIFGLFAIPSLIPAHSAPSWIGSAHGYVGWVFFWLLALHIASALYHALIRQDGVMTRIIRS
ncbi:MAG: cytochrome b/b6 domain-containing protein [Salinisphaera sp.]|jgi:cytochrome b561|nr:cytochrome b/b6 domain-containing protein [Salinisphaera sp.]